MGMLLCFVSGGVVGALCMALFCAPRVMHDGYSPDLLDHEYQTENTVDGDKKDGLH